MPPTVASCFADKRKRNRYRSFSRHPGCVSSLSGIPRSARTAPAPHLRISHRVALNKVSTLKARRWISDVKLPRLLRVQSNSCATPFAPAETRRCLRERFTMAYMYADIISARDTWSGSTVNKHECRMKSAISATQNKGTDRYHECDESSMRIKRARIKKQ